MEFLLALQFLTRVPIKTNHVFEEKKLGRAMAYFPFIGLLLGASTAAVQATLSIFVDSLVADLMAILFLTVVTGNMHLDGLMDTADGLFSGKPREAMLKIMKDSHVGAHGVIAGCFVVLLKLVLLMQVPVEHKGLVLILMPITGRWSQVYAAAFYPYVRKGPGKSFFTQHVGTREILLASIFTLGVMMIVLGINGGFLAGTIFLGTIVISRYFTGKIGGITGDILGAQNELIEILGIFTLQFLLQ